MVVSSFVTKTTGEAKLEQSEHESPSRPRAMERMVFIDMRCALLPRKEVPHKGTSGQLFAHTYYVHIETEEAQTRIVPIVGKDLIACAGLTQADENLRQEHGVDSTTVQEIRNTRCQRDGSWQI